MAKTSQSGSVGMRTDRLIAACEGALQRLFGKELAGINPDVFPELGETLFWLCGLAEARGRQDALLLGLKWARNRIAHGLLVVAPVAWQYGSEPGRLVPGSAIPGAHSHHRWLDRGAVALGPKDRPAPAQESAYDIQVAGKGVTETLHRALDLLR